MAEFDLAVIGAGVYGLTTALRMEAAGARVFLLDRYEPGHPGAASSGLTRAAHTLYDDPLYHNLAAASLQEYRMMNADFIASCDAIVFAEKRDAITQAQKLNDHGFVPHLALKSEEVNARYSDFMADYACLDTQGGVFRVERVRHHLLAELKASSVECAFNTELMGIIRQKEGYALSCHDGRIFQAKKLLIAAGEYSQSVLNVFEDMTLDLKLKRVKPGTLHHFKPRNTKQMAQALAMPAFAYIERGVFGLPSVEGYSDCVKIAGYFDPQSSELNGEEPLSFLETHASFLLDFEPYEPRIRDECRYDYTQDGHFILGALPDHDDAFIACGWNGGGYKFAPAIAGLLAACLQNDDDALPDVFSPRRILG